MGVSTWFYTILQYVQHVSDHLRSDHLSFIQSDGLRLFRAPFVGVLFADFWLADQMNSLVTSFTDFGYFVCFYSSQVCNSFEILTSILIFYKPGERLLIKTKLFIK